jgi:hypothetical protein
MFKFGFRNPAVIIEEEDPAHIQLTTQISADKLFPKSKLNNPRKLRNSIIPKPNTLQY